jgi:hypothetical protein
MSDPVPPRSPTAARLRRLAGAVIAITIAWLLVIASVQAQFPRPEGLSAIPGPPDNPGPTIEAIHVTVDGRVTDRVEIGEDIAVTADVGESKTAVSRLVFKWNPPVGEIVGEGPSVLWRIPRGAATPVSPVLTLDLIEQYPDFETGIVPKMREHRTSAEAPVMHVNDSVAELTKLAHAFLVDYFGNSRVSPEASLVDFSDTCKGKADELDDIRLNRALYTIRTAAMRVGEIEFHPSMNAAYITAPCEIHDIERATGRPHMMKADCLLTAVYDKPRWYLCDSHTANGMDGYEDDLARRGLLPPPMPAKP